MDNHFPYHIKISHDRMVATLNKVEDTVEETTEVTREGIEHMLQDNKILFGVDWDALADFENDPESVAFPLVIAKGIAPINGIDGDITYQANLATGIKGEKINFRDVMRIPSARKGEKIATLIAPKAGQDGTDVSGQPIHAKPGQPYKMKAGKNVVFREADQSFYAAEEGQISIGKRRIDVQSVYDVHDDLSMRTGNLDFVGTIVIHGNVPTGYKVKADGDIKVFGMVEAAELQAGGSIYISEGFSGQANGKIHATENVQAGYINQGHVRAGNNIHVEKSIIHSNCIAGSHIICPKGSIIGGSISAGVQIEVNDLGNRMNSKTEVFLGPDQSLQLKLKQLTAKKEELESTLEKLHLLGEKLAHTRDDSQKTKMQIMKLRQKNAFRQTREQLQDVMTELESITEIFNIGEDATLLVSGMLYRNVGIYFGKYAHMVAHDRKSVSVRLVENDVSIQSLHTGQKQD
ncbi:DUF342 domain-containing protein [Lentibacillus saliphilus]|uniref:DUF342 domain-containing protein n=1 Tax=Lentibacillus saliphilus TaxID=2737028 RepID=UPI001C304986|nr:FapA family protein [Lentibacillus saliphilus]